MICQSCEEWMTPVVDRDQQIVRCSMCGHQQTHRFLPLFIITWNVRANTSNQASFRLNVTHGSLTNPVVVIHSYSAAVAPTTILINEATKTADVDYFASLDGANKQLWLTLKGSFSATTAIGIASGPPSLFSTIYLPLTRRE